MQYLPFEMNTQESSAHNVHVPLASTQ